MKARLLLLTVLVSLAPLASACDVQHPERDAVLKAIARTEAVARAFAYVERSGGHLTQVRGDIADDLRYQLAMTLDGRPAAAEVVVDDARALQLPSPDLRGKMLLQAATATGASAQAARATVPAALVAGRWVVDPGGMGPLSAAGVEGRQVGNDPLLDALLSLEYVRASITQAAAVVRFNPESQNYRPQLDPFPRPDRGTVRYDLVPPPLPARQGGEVAQAQAQLPATPFFRVMAIYVKDGLVVQARERISVELRLRDPQSGLATRLSDYVKVPADAGVAEQARALAAALNRGLGHTSVAQIRERDLVVSFTAFGHKAAIQVPRSAVPGRLWMFEGQGQVLFEQL